MYCITLVMHTKRNNVTPTEQSIQLMLIDNPISSQLITAVGLHVTAVATFTFLQLLILQQFMRQTEKRERNWLVMGSPGLSSIPTPWPQKEWLRGLCISKTEQEHHCHLCCRFCRHIILHRQDSQSGRCSVARALRRTRLIFRPSKEAHCSLIRKLLNGKLKSQD